MSARAPHHNKPQPEPLATAPDRFVPVPAEVIHPHVGAHALLTASPVRRASSAAEQARALGLVVGDTIEGREEGPRGYWHEAKLTLLWLGDEVAVWSVTERSRARPNWSEPEESANWTLECRQWRKVGA